MVAQKVKVRNQPQIVNKVTRAFGLEGVGGAGCCKPSKLSKSQVSTRLRLWLRG